MNEPKPITSGLSVGRVVHYVMSDGQHRPALVVRVEPGATTINLQVFTDGSNDAEIPDFMADADAIEHGLWWRPSTPYSDQHIPGSWHWPEYVP